MLITGAGPIGLLVLQAARAVGAGETVVTDVNPGRLAHARRLGADRALDTSREPLPQDPVFDIALDCSGIESALTAAAHAVRPGGTVVAVGNPPQPRTTLPLAWMQRQELTLVTAFRYAGSSPRRCPWPPPDGSTWSRWSPPASPSNVRRTPSRRRSPTPHS
ncbi:hypothetical protein GCM10017744_012920 [Streptomyces antimycoticus]